MKPALDTAAVGYRFVSVADPVQRAAVPVHLLYPASGTAKQVSFGPYAVDVAQDAPCAGGRLPVVVLSHGSGGTPWTLRDLGLHLAWNGFVAVLPEHIGNSRSDNSLEGTPDNLLNRPRHVSLALDAAAAEPLLAGHALPDRAGIVGLSMGGYTALACAGGRPWAGPREAPGGRPIPLDASRDARVRALVLLAPATPWFMAEGALAEVRVPILMRSGSEDAITPAWHAEIVHRGVGAPFLIDHEVVAGAGHFSFMSPFPPEMTHAGFPPSQDPPGFDRKAYAPRLHADVAAFLRRTLSGAQG